MSTSHRSMTAESILLPLRAALEHLRLVRNVAEYFDPQERRLVVQSVVIGAAVWAVVFGLKSGVQWAFHAVLHWVERSPSIFTIFGPLLLGALVMAALVRYASGVVHYRDQEGHVHALIDVEGDGLERAISLYYTSEPSFEQALLGKEGVDVRWELPTFKLAARKFVATLVTLASGGSGGLEASVALIGESVAAGLFKPRPRVAAANSRLGLLGRFWRWWCPQDPDDLQTAQLGGIAAAVATLLGAPFAAAFFATEVMYRRRPIIEKLVYALIAALVAFFLTHLVSGHAVIFEVAALPDPPTTLRYYGVLTLMAALVSLVSIYFSHLRTRFEDGFHRLHPNLWLRHLAGAVLTGAIALLAAFVTGQGLDLVLGPGESAIDAALAGELTIGVALIALLAKLLATLATIGSGGSAGLLVPSIFLGTMVAAALAPVFNYPPMMLIIPAMTASLVSIVNVPLAAILFTVEVFGAPYMVPALVVLVVTAILAHENSIYRAQRQKAEEREILPGFSVRRVAVPEPWVGQTIVNLQIRHRFELNVIGLVEGHSHNGERHRHVRLNPPATTPLKADDVLVVLGEDQKLDAFEAILRSGAS
ncbi:MAG: chloride channel protein [Ardenticatenaceae bacterium]|nr:chloride channel protein [Ardenticatenaceae bacterium]